MFSITSFRANQRGVSRRLTIIPISFSEAQTAECFSVQTVDTYKLIAVRRQSWKAKLIRNFWNGRIIQLADYKRECNLGFALSAGLNKSLHNQIFGSMFIGSYFQKYNFSATEFKATWTTFYRKIKCIRHSFQTLFTIGRNLRTWPVVATRYEVVIPQLMKARVHALFSLFHSHSYQSVVNVSRSSCRNLRLTILPLSSSSMLRMD